MQIRILFIIFSFDIEAVGGGISRYVVSLCEALDQSAFQISLCGLWNHGTQIEADRILMLNKKGIQAFTCAPWDELHPYRSFFNAYRRLREILKSESIDIIHSHSLFGDIAALMLHFEMKAPVIIRTLHNELRTEWSRRPIRRLLLTNILYPLCFDVEIGVSKYITDGLYKRWFSRRLGRQPITVYNAIDLNRFMNMYFDRSKTKRALEIPDDAFLIGTVGRLTKQKGYDLLLDSAAKVVSAYQKLYYVIVGDGEDANTLKQQAKRLMIEPRVIFTGLRSDVDALIYAFDLFVCSSRWEGLSTVILEAMAAETPILATDIPGNRELLQPGVSAWFVPAENAEELANGVIKAYQNTELSKKFAQNAMQRLPLFKIEQTARIHQRLYLLLQNEKKTNRCLNHKRLDALINKQINND